jgi:CheY-like chemotaxis protein
VEVHVEADPSFIRIEVSDTGPGIDEAFLPRIFSEFEQESQGIGRDYEGAGLGLTITQRLIEKLGGGIEVVSRKGRGTTFTVTFPRSDAAPTPDALPSVQKQQPRILVVDDNQQTRFLLERMLHAHYLVDTAGTADEAFHLTEEHVYDAILLDINLGAKTSGEDVMLRLRERERYAQTPIVAFTAYALPGDRERFLHQGFDGYLSKPFTRKQLTTLLEEMLPDTPASVPVWTEPSLLLGPYAPRPTRPAPTSASPPLNGTS